MEVNWQIQDIDFVLDLAIYKVVNEAESPDSAVLDVYIYIIIGHR